MLNDSKGGGVRSLVKCFSFSEENKKLLVSTDYFSQQYLPETIERSSSVSEQVTSFGLVDREYGF